MKCPGCGAAELEVFFQTESVPVFCNVLWPTRRQALRAPRASIQLGFCPRCAYIYNVAFDPALVRYAPAYENSLHYSPQFQEYALSLARQLVERRHLYNKHIVEIGCGRGDFLAMLCRIGGNRGFGFDPSYDAAAPSPHPDVTIRPEPYSRHHRRCRADFVCCRQVLEHIPEPISFLREIRRTLDGNAGLFFEVPCALYTLKELGVWDILYEHCSYFVGRSLAEVLCRAGFAPVNLQETFGGQFLTADAALADARVATDDSLDSAAVTFGLVADFDRAYRHKIEHWRSAVEQIRSSGRATVLWGAGTKGVTFLNTLNVPDTVIPYIVDLNPRKHGRFVPGTAQRVVPPSFLQERRVEQIIAMNPNYAAEIRAMVAGMGLAAKVVCA